LKSLVEKLLGGQLPLRPKPEETYFVGRCFAGLATIFTAFGSLFVANNLLFVAGVAGFLSVVIPRKAPKSVLLLMLVAAIGYVGAMSYDSISYYFRPHVEGNYNAWPIHLVFCIAVGIVILELAQELRSREGNHVAKE
jgi:hypothetical protein